MLRTRTRAVTADDFEVLARQVPASSARDASHRGHSPAPERTPPGRVMLAVLPQVDDPVGYIPPKRLTLSAELKRSVENYLNERRLLGTSLEVISPKLVWVSITRGSSA